MIDHSIGPVFSAGGVIDRGADDLAENYHEASKITRITHTGWTDVRFLQLAATDTLGEPTSAPGLQPRVPLHPPLPLTDALTAVLDARVSWPADDLTGTVGFDQLSTVLHYAYCERPHSPGRRFVPSGGALYPLDLYVAVRDVHGLDPGIYQLDPIDRALVDRSPGDGPSRLEALAGATPTLMSRVARTAPVSVYITVSFERSRYKYGLRGYRLSLFEAGHVAQNAGLVATAIGIPSLGWVGFLDHEVDDALELDGVTQSALYAFSFGGGSGSAVRAA